MAAPEQNRYSAIIEAIFFDSYKKGTTEVQFAREDIEHVAKRLGIKLPKNLGDLIYSFRHRTNLPERIVQTATTGREWIIRATGRSRYSFVLAKYSSIQPNPQLVQTKIPDATPGMIVRYALSDEQALLAKLRYNRLVDIFSGVACYSLQSHLRTTVPGMGQVETDEVYVGVDRRGVQYVFPVQAKGGNDKLGAVQIEQDVALCADKFPALVCRPLGAQFMAEDVIALFELQIDTDNELKIVHEKHYKLVPPDEVTDEDLKTYRQRR
jgi:hypothetical protein